MKSNSVKTTGSNWARDLTPGHNSGPPTIAGIKQGKFGFEEAKQLYDMRIDGVTYARDPRGDDDTTRIIKWESTCWGVYSRNSALHVRSLFKSAGFKTALSDTYFFLCRPGRLEVHWGPL